MPDCAQCIDADLGRICPHQGPGLLVYERGYDQGRADEYEGRAAGRAEVAVVLIDLIAQLRETAATKPGATGRLLREMAGGAEARLREVTGDE